MTEPTDAELDELRQANGGKLNFVTFSEFRTIARAALAKWGAQPVVRRAPTAAFDDPRVQAVYEILCDDTDWPPKDEPQQHWEGWIARRIVERLFQEPEEGANAHDMRYAHGGVAERCEEVKRAMDVVVELERRGMLEAQPVACEPLTDEQIKAAAAYHEIPIRQTRAFIIGARFAEQHHGIKGGQHGTE